MNENIMHDWTFVRLEFDWLNGFASLVFNNARSEEVIVLAKGVKHLQVPKREEWGESVSVNETDGPRSIKNGLSYLAIEIQSGDKIEIEAKSISMPI